MKREEVSMVAAFVLQAVKSHITQLLGAGAKIAARDILVEFLVWCYMNIPGDVVQSATNLAKQRLQEAGLRGPDPPKEKK